MAQHLRTLAALTWPGLRFQHSHDGCQPPVTPVSRNLTPSSGLQGHQAHMVYLYTRRQNTYTHKIEINEYLLKIKSFIHLFVYMCVDMHVPQQACGGQRAATRNWFSPCTMWVPRIKLRLSGLEARTFTYWTISLAPTWLDLDLPRKYVFGYVYEGSFREL